MIPAHLRLFVVAVLCASTSGAVPSAVDVPQMLLNSGASVPAVGLGTWQIPDDKLEAALDAALEAGYRHFDTATIYWNEHIIGNVISRWIREGKVKREDLFISTKLPVHGMRAADVPDFLNQSLSKLQTPYVDLYLIHMPFAMRRDVYSGGRITDVGPEGSDKTTDHVAIWKAMEAEHAAGRARSLGVSNFNESQVQRLLNEGTVPPANLQVELHLYHQQKPLVAFCKKNNVSVTAFATLGSPGSKWLSVVNNKPLPDLLGLEAVKEVAARHNKTTAQVLLRHTLQQGVIVIPKSSKPQRVRENIDILDFTLDDSEMAKLDALDKGLDGKLFIMKHIAGSENHPEYPWSALI